MDQLVEEIKEVISARSGETIMSSLMIIQTQLLATKFYAPTSPGTLIRRSRLSALLNESLKYPLTLISAPAGFGKTTLLSTWAKSLSATQARVAWLSLDEEENDPQLFWTYVLSALDQQQPERFTPLSKSLQSAQAPSLYAILTSLINLALESCEHLVLVLDDYHAITEQQVHTTLCYLVEHLPPHLHIILATRTDPPLPLALLRTRGLLLEIRTEQLRCTIEETNAFLQQVMALQLPDQTIQEVRSRTEGWLVGLHLLALSLPEHVEPLTLLQQISGEHRYILDYLTEVVLQQQPAEVQRFLLCTCILERLSASLCDAVMERTGSQEMLKYLERSNLFVVSLDSKRQWYRYHALFAEALYSQLKQSSSNLVPILHHRASRWYAQHNQTTQAMQHAFRAKEWQWAADLLEQAHPPLISFAWGVNRYALVQFRQWMEQLPTEILASRPRLCLACAHLLWTITPQELLCRWLDLAEAALRASLKAQTRTPVSQGNLSPQEQQEQLDLLGKVLTLRCTLVQTFQADGRAALVTGEQAQALLSPENAAFRAIAATGQGITSYLSAVNNAVAAIKYGYQAVLLAQEAGQPIVALAMMTPTIMHLIGAGCLHEAEQLTQRALCLETPSGSPDMPELGWIMILQAEILRERNDLAAARALASEAIALCEQSITLVSLYVLYWGYAVQMRISLSCGDVAAADTFLQQAEQIGKLLSQQVYLVQRSYFTIVDQVRLWLACGELDRATHWAEQLDVLPQHLTPFAHERQEVARARILLAKDQPTAALQRLEPALHRATAGQRWGHVIEIHLLQALAHQKLDEQAQVLVALSEAVHLGEPEGYIRTFVDEGTPMADLLSELREEQRKDRPTPYLDMLLAAFAKESKVPKRLSKQSRSRRSR
jgi:LuxR family maltose regulon positive regulatory protein